MCQARRLVLKGKTLVGKDIINLESPFSRNQGESGAPSVYSLTRSGPPAEEGTKAATSTGNGSANSPELFAQRASALRQERRFTA